MPQSKPLISIVNVVATASIDQRLDLKDVTEKFQEVENDLLPFDDIKIAREALELRS